MPSDAIFIWFGLDRDCPDLRRCDAIRCGSGQFGPIPGTVNIQNNLMRIVICKRLKEDILLHPTATASPDLRIINAVHFLLKRGNGPHNEHMTVQNTSDPEYFTKNLQNYPRINVKFYIFCP